MAGYTKQSLEMAVRDICGDAVFAHVNLPRACSMAAEECFLKRREDQYAQFIREALEDLYGPPGRFLFSPPPAP